MKKIAFLFLIYDEINNELLWHNFFKKIEKNRYSIFIHWKHDRQLEHFEKFKLKNTIPTEYAELSLVKTQNLLLREALKDEKNERFVFISNACIPLKPFDHIYRSLFSNDYSLFNAAREEHIFERNRGGNIAKVFGQRNVKKASQWSVLTRPIAQELSASDDVLEAIFEPGKKDLADEYFYLSYLNYLGKEKHLKLSQYSAVECATFEFWEDKNYKYNENFTTAHPENWDRRLKTYSSISKEEIHYLLSAPCLFGRKFVPQCFVGNGKKTVCEEISEFYNL